MTYTKHLTLSMLTTAIFLYSDTSISENISYQYHAEGESKEFSQSLKVALTVSNGQFVQLSDNSVWEIAPDDLTTSQSWLSAIPVKITTTTHPTYPYLITNLENNVSVKAKKGQLPDFSK